MRKLDCITIVLFGILTFFPGYTQQTIKLDYDEKEINKIVAQQKTPNFQVPVGNAQVDFMQLIAPEKLLVGLRKDSPKLPGLEYLLINPKDGNILWRYDRSSGVYEVYSILSDHIIFEITDKKAKRFVALELATGQLAWQNTFKKGFLASQLIPESNQLWVYYQSSKKKVALKAVDLQNGLAVFETFISNFSLDKVPLPLINEKGIYAFYNGLEKLNAHTAEVQYALDEIRLDNKAPTPISYKSGLLLVTADKELIALEENTGSVIWKHQLTDTIDYTNLYVEDDILYIRGLQKKDGKYSLLAFDITQKKLLWDFVSKEALLSNFVVHNDILFFGTATSLYAVEQLSGAVKFAKKITNTGRSFPTSIRLYDDVIVYIGELVIAAYDLNTGKQKYKHGISALGTKMHFNGLDASLPELKKRLGIVDKNLDALREQKFNQAVNYQKEANFHYKEYVDAKRLGRSDEATKNYISYSISNEFAKSQVAIDLGFTLANLAQTIVKVVDQASIAAQIREQELFRQSILDVYAKSEVGEYVFRPHLKYLNNQSYVALNLIHLPTGKKRYTYLSPSYDDYGLWTIVDSENNMVYHHGVGMDVSKYEYGPPIRNVLVRFIKAKTFIIGTPIEFVE